MPDEGPFLRGPQHRLVILLTIPPGPGLEDVHVTNTRQPVTSRGRTFTPYPFSIEWIGMGHVLVAAEVSVIRVPLSGMTADIELVEVEAPDEPLGPPIRLEQKPRMPWESIVAFHRFVEPDSGS